MMFFTRFFITRVKLLISPSFFVAVFLFVAAVFSLGNVFSGSDALKIRVGLLHSGGERAAIIEKYVSDYLGENGEVFIVSNRVEMETLVARRNIECGFIIGDEIEDGKFEGAITLIKSPLTAADQILSLYVVSGLVQGISGELGYDVVRQFFRGSDKREVVSFIQGKANEYTKNGALMGVEYEITGEQNTQAQTGNNMLAQTLYGLTALFAMLISLMVSLGISHEKLENVYGKIKSSGVEIWLYVVYNFLFVFAVSFLFMFISTLLINSSVAQFNFFGTALISFCYCAAVSALCVFYVSVFKPQFFYGVIIFSFVTTAAFGDCIIRIGGLIKGADVARLLFFTSYFMDGLGKAFPVFETAVLLGASCVLLLSAVWLEKRLGY